MAAVVLDPPLVIECGATLSFTFFYHQLVVDEDTGEVVLDEDNNPVLGDPQSLDGCLVRMQVRRKPRDGDVYMYGDSSDYQEQTNPQGGRIFLEAGDETGRVDVVFTDLDTMACQDLNTDVFPGYFDMECEYPILNGEIRPFVERMLEGQVLVDPNTTRTET